jgi:monofunctional biosynthetic peptidoglycan transglycosylase
MRRLARRALLWLAILLVALPLGYLALFRFAPVPGTPLMLIRLFEGEGLARDWVPLERVSPQLMRAVIAAEDARFCRHYGFDLDAIEAAIEDYAEGGKLRGASTISQQTAKNLFLWGGGGMARKGVEAWLTVLVETLWPKRRILETYLNVAEWGPGIYGAEAAARAHFGKPASTLTMQEAALLAAVLPNPRLFSASRPSAYISRRAATVRARMPGVRLADGGQCP